MAEWIEKEFDLDTFYECSNCGEEFVTLGGTPTDNGWDFCPKCGAKMDGSKEDQNGQDENGLLPCPFCGGKADFGYIYYESPHGITIMCKECGVSTKKFEMNIDYSAKDKAIEAWNMREGERK